MKIAIDARWIFPEISGIGNYTRQILTQFGRIAPQHQFLLLFNDAELMQRTLAETGVKDADNMKAECLPWGVFSPKSQLLLPKYLKKNRVDVFHSPNYMIPLLAFPRKKDVALAVPGQSGKNNFSGIKCVTTIHDLIPLVFPNHAPKSRKSRLFPIFKALMNEVGRRSDAIITVSNASRDDILQYMHIPQSRADIVHTVYNGVSQRFTPSPNVTENSCPTLLYVGRADPYKNLETLIEAVAIIRKTTELPVKLLLTGSPDPRYPQAEQAAERLNIAEHVQWTGYLSDDDLLETYRAADLLVHPSRYEGFGLQIIEAMACGTPVVCSNGGSLPEVAGDAAIMVDPDDAGAFASEIIKVLTQPATAAKMREKGLQQAAEFTWEKTARETLAVYEKTAAKGSTTA
jgi:glycosyltransferase involved in cell wall biosynthesis